MARGQKDCLFDLCIVGAGMIGSAAAKHASFNPGLRVCLIGPDEPSERHLSDGRDIYGAHYDEGRITRISDPDPVWAILARNSIRRYRDIENESGISFYKEVGVMQVGTRDSQYINDIRQTNSALNISSREMNVADMGKIFPYISFAADDIAHYQSTNGGHISPRNLVRAQQVIASRHGCTLIRDVVANIRRMVQSDGSYVMEVTTDSGSIYRSKTVLVTTGAFTTFRNILPYTDVVPDCKLYPITVSLVEVSPDYAEKLRSMPSISYRGKGGKDWFSGYPRNNDDQSVSYYMLPPIKYPDGRYYIKLGHNHTTIPKSIQTSDEAKRWFCEGDPKLVRTIADLIISMFSGIEPLSIKGDQCVIVETPTVRPYIDMVHSQLGVAIGENGYAAKSSDEIGRIAAAMIMKGWDSEIPKEKFTLRLKSKDKKSGYAKSNL
ncbi:hypothetical protein CHS0354_029827 [Potamilus streckersoni]|uniref:FAD dependent oxidoreductase domain-containing protein n=1 Tax=Potamilus streckersoni TaxID=2493646 RepID=A0AAE0VDV8_9BIVA|nr:hypothetical protein CHS0354_029827 [Potamilus streckersoni]